MKKDSKCRYANKDLYRAFDNYFKYEKEEDRLLAELYLKKNNISVIEDTRHYGLFFYGKEKRIRIDPIRYNKKIGLNKEQLKVINNRKTHYFYPYRQKYYDYSCNYIREEFSSLKSMWQYEFKPIIDAAIEKIESMKFGPGDDYNFLCGVSSFGAANARTKWKTESSRITADYKKFGLKTNQYASFFHLMASRIEAIMVKVLRINNVDTKKHIREVIDGTVIQKDKKIEELDNYKDYDMLYSIWNFIKHNNLSAHKKMFNHYKHLLFSEEDYQSGNLAIYYVSIDEKMINELLEGVEKFLVCYCNLVLKENYDEALWNYDDYFISQVNDQIECITNPFGLDMFDDVD